MVDNDIIYITLIFLPILHIYISQIKNCFRCLHFKDSDMRYIDPWEEGDVPGLLPLQPHTASCTSQGCPAAAGGSCRRQRPPHPWECPLQQLK